MSGFRIPLTRSPWKTASWLLLGACALALLLGSSSAQATSGALDQSFGTGGKVMTDVGCCGADAYAYGLARQPDGKLVVAGTAYTNGTAQDFALVRYNPDGSLDTSFGGTGKVVTAIGPSYDVANDIALQPDGKIVVAGYTNNGSNSDFALARYNADGSLDTSFNGTGKVTTPIGAGNDQADALAVQPDGKLVAAGRSYNGVNDDFAVVRYNPNGSLDTSFNGTGKVTTAIGPGDESADDVAVQPDGKIAVAGNTWDGSEEAFSLVRYNANGSLDTSFNGTGKQTTAIGGYAAANALRLQADGKLVAAGVANVAGHFVFALARYNANGALDPTFGSSGKVTTAVGPSQDDIVALVQEPDGSLLAAGYSYTGSDEDFALARYRADGSLDPAFGSGGKVTTAISSGKDEAYAVALLPDGKLVAAGYGWSGSREVFALARYNGSSVTVSTAGSGSGTVTSSPNGIACGATCSAPFASVPVTLTATPAAGSSFTGWSGACSGTATCTVTVNADRAVTATFDSDKALALATAGTGAGVVTSSPDGINCGSTCTHSFRHGTPVTLTAAPSPGSTFTGWSGACSGTGTCSVVMDAGRSVTATFTKAVAVCVVPKLKGKTLAAARRALKSAHCSAGKVTRSYSAHVRKGRVSSQSPRAGRKLAAAAKVRFTLSKGKRP